MRQDVAEKNKLTSLADLSRYLKEGGTFKLAASAEFIERADALPAFEKAYGFKLGQDQLPSLAGGDTAVTIVPLPSKPLALMRRWLTALTARSRRWGCKP